MSNGSSLVHHKSVSSSCHLLHTTVSGVELRGWDAVAGVERWREKRSVFSTLSSTPFYQVTASTLEWMLS